MPRQQVPTLQFPTINGSDYDLVKQAPDNFTLIVFYRGLHCPICANYLRELGRLLPEFNKRGVDVVAVSSDQRDRAQRMFEKLKSKQFLLGYNLNLETAKNWGLYISTSKGMTSIGLEEPALFSEPGIFLVRPDQTLFYANIQTMPFARPMFTELLSAIDFTLEHNYPARGQYIGAV
ncbi:peroxiredoxin-like family protein [Shewanella mangrovi]|nr:peroxiredoxin-like family protein [Shewanella mangrovi]